MTRGGPSPSARRGTSALVAGVRAGDVEVATLTVAAGARLPRLALDEIEALLVLQGSLVVRSGSQAPVTVRADSGIVRYLAEPLDIAAAADATLVSARAPAPREANGKSLVRSRVWVSLPAPAADALRELHRTLSAGQRASPRLEGLALVAVAWAEQTLASDGAAVERPHWLGRVTERLHEVGSRPSVAGLAREAGVAPAHLARVFRQAEGCTIGEYHRRVQIDAACRLMLDGKLPLSVIAVATGFADHAHLSKTFRKATGVSPREYRRAAAAESPGDRPAPPFFDPVGRFAFRSRTADGTPYDGTIVIERAGNTLGGVVRTTVMPDVPIETIAVHGHRLLLTALVPAGLAVLDVRVRGAEIEGEWRLAGKGTALRGRRNTGGG